MFQDLPKSAVLDYQPAALDSRSAYRWLVVAMLWCVCLFNYADRQAIYSVFPLLKSEMKLTDIQLGIVGGSFMWVYAGTIAGGTAAGFLAEKYGWRSGFYMFGTLGIFLGLVLLFTLKEPQRGQSEQIEVPPDKEQILNAILSILSTPMVLILILV